MVFLAAYPIEVKTPRCTSLAKWHLTREMLIMNQSQENQSFDQWTNLKLYMSACNDVVIHNTVSMVKMVLLSCHLKDDII